MQWRKSASLSNNRKVMYDIEAPDRKVRGFFVRNKVFVLIFEEFTYSIPTTSLSFGYSISIAYV